MEAFSSSNLYSQLIEIDRGAIPADFIPHRIFLIPEDFHIDRVHAAFAVSPGNRKYLVKRNSSKRFWIGELHRKHHHNMPLHFSVILSFYPNRDLLPLFHFSDITLLGLRFIIENQFLVIHFDRRIEQDWAERCSIPQLHTSKIFDTTIYPTVMTLTIHMDTFCNIRYGLFKDSRKGAAGEKT